MRPLLFLLLISVGLTSHAQTAQEWCEMALKANDANLTIEYADRALKLDPNKTWAYLLRGHGNLLKGYEEDGSVSYQKAITDYTEAIRLDPKYTDAYLGRGLAKHKLRRYQEAIQDFDEVVRLDPQKPGVYDSRGISKLNLGLHQEAIQNFDEAIRLNHKDAQIYNNRGFAKNNLKRYQEAITDYNEAIISLGAKDPITYNNRGVAKRNLSLNQEAIYDFDEAIRLDPKFADAYNNRGFAKNNLKSYQQAIQDYDEAIRLGAKDAITYNNRGAAKKNLSLHREAIYDFDEAIRLDPKFAKAYLNKGQSLFQLKRFAEALDFFAQGEALDKTITYHLKDKESATAAVSARNEPDRPVYFAKRYAFIIGNSAYQHGSQLENRPLNDARDISARLKQLGFQVTLLTDGTKSQVEAALGQFSKAAQRSDVALFFFAGHGIEAEGINYLIPVDATLESPEDARLQGISLDLILGEMKRYQTKVNLVYLDACRNNPFRSWSRGGNRSFTQVGKLSQSTKVYYATQPGDVANNGSGRNGIFTTALLNHLKKGIEIEALMRAVTVDVIQSTNNNQQPYSAGTLLTQFEF